MADKQVPTFTCSECGETHSIRRLSKLSVRIAQTSKSEALLVLDPSDILCDNCGDDLLAEGADVLAGDVFGRTDIERFENSGVILDPGQAVFLTLNY